MVFSVFSAFSSVPTWFRETQTKDKVSYSMLRNLSWSTSIMVQIKRQEWILEAIRKLIHKYEFRRTFLLRKALDVVSLCVVDVMTSLKSELEEKFIKITLNVIKDYKGTVANKTSILNLYDS